MSGLAEDKRRRAAIEKARRLLISNGYEVIRTEHRRRELRQEPVDLVAIKTREKYYARYPKGGIKFISIALDEDEIGILRDELDSLPLHSTFTKEIWIKERHKQIFERIIVEDKLIELNEYRIDETEKRKKKTPKKRREKLPSLRQEKVT